MHLKKIMVWVAPLCILLIGITQLFIDNYNEVTEPPSDGWSRDLKIGQTTNATTFNLSTTDDNQLALSFLTNDGIAEKVFAPDTYELTEENSYQIPVTKFTDFYFEGENFVYSDYYSVYDGQTKEKITDIDGFYPLDSKVYVRKENKIAQLHMDTLKTEEVFTVADENTEVIPEQAGESTYFLTTKVDQSGNHLTFYKQTGDHFEQIGQTVLRLDSSEEIDHIQFAVNEETYTLFIKSLQKQSMAGKAVNNYYIAKASFTEKPILESLTFKDPHGKSELSGVSDVDVRFTEEGTRLLFKAFGATNTRFGETHQFNIYEAAIGKGQTKEVRRLSNTPSSSLKPAWYNSHTIVWMDRGSNDKNRILLSSSDPVVIERADQVTRLVFLQTLGKTMGMLASSLFAIMISSFWFIWPILFMAGVMLVNGKAMDHYRNWVFYTGVFIYLGAATIYKNKIFTDHVMTATPDYLGFQGSSFIYIAGFALLTYAIIMYGTNTRKWTPSVKLTYFIGIHITCITIFFGPYLL